MRSSSLLYLQTRYERECQRHSPIYTQTSQWYVGDSLLEKLRTPKWYPRGILRCMIVRWMQEKNNPPPCQR